MRRLLGLSVSLLVIASVLAVSACGEDPAPTTPETAPDAAPAAAPVDRYAELDLPTARQVTPIHAGLAIEVSVSRSGLTVWMLDGKPVDGPDTLEARLDPGRDPDHLRGIWKHPVRFAVDERAPWAATVRMLLPLYLLRAPHLAFVVRGTESPEATTLPAPIPALLEEEGGQPWLDEGFEVSLRRVRGNADVSSNHASVPKGVLAEVATPLEAALFAMAGRVDVVRLRAAADVDSGDVIRLIDICRAAGLPRIHLVPFDELMLRAILSSSHAARGSLRVVSAAPASTRKGVKLAVAASAKAETAEHEVVEILLDENGVNWCGGREVTHAELQTRLMLRADTARESTPLRASEVGILLTVDAGVPWRRVQWLMQDAAHPDVRIYRIYWNVRTRPGGPEGQLRVFLPMDRGLAGGPAPDGRQGPSAGLILRADRPGDPTRLVLARLWPDRKEIDLGTDGSGYAKVAKQLETLHGRNPGAGVSIDAGADVPFSEVVRAVDTILASGLENVVFIGTPPPRPGD